MRIHTSLTHSDLSLIHVAGVRADVTEHGSRTHGRAFEVKLSGTGYARNTGRYGADPYDRTATWDEWGCWLDALFLLDPSARCGSARHPVYADRADFRVATGYRYDDLDVADQHRRHRWNYQTDGSSECACGAVRWPVNTPDPHASLAR